MSEILKGNFTTKETVVKKQVEVDKEQTFEMEALKHLGGSIAFVSKKRVKWDADPDK